MPKSMQCKATAVNEGGMRVSVPREITVTRVIGTGAPDEIGRKSRDSYVISLGDGINRTSNAVWFTVETKDTYQSVKSFGSFHFAAEFSGLNLRISDYNERTQLFKGTLQFGDKEAYRSFTVLCDGGAADIGL